MPTALPTPHQLCAKLISVCTSSGCEFVGKVQKSLNVLLELTKDEKTALNHPSWTLLRAYSPQRVLRRRWVVRYRDHILRSLHRFVFVEGCVRVNAFQQGLRGSVSETKAEQDIVSITTC